MCLTRQHQSKMYLNVSKCIQMYLSVLFHVLSQLDPHLMLLRWTSQLRSPTTRRSSLSKWWGLDPRSRWFTRRKSKDNWTLPNFYLVWWLQTFHRKTINFSSFFFPESSVLGHRLWGRVQTPFPSPSMARPWRPRPGDGSGLWLDAAAVSMARQKFWNQQLLDRLIYTHIYIDCLVMSCCIYTNIHICNNI